MEVSPVSQCGGGGGDGGAGGGVGHSGAKHEYWQLPCTLSWLYGMDPSEHVAASDPQSQSVIPMLASHAQQSPPSEVHLELSAMHAAGHSGG